MDDLLTTKELQELLKIDRTTVYRMLKDGRLNGTKVGEQWRFSRREVESLLSGAPSTEPVNAVVSSVAVLPLHCIQPVQNVFAEVAGVGSVTTAPNGEPLTEISNSCRFCNLILATESGRRACQASWARLASQPEPQPHFVACHAGLQYARARIEVNGVFEAMLIAGQFYIQRPEATEEMARIQALAEKHGLAPADLAEAAREILLLEAHKQARIGDWLESVAHTFEQIGCERKDFIDRLQRIAEMSSFDSV
jgi:excisionase family DNA binding protein